MSRQSEGARESAGGVEGGLLLFHLSLIGIGFDPNEEVAFLNGLPLDDG